MSTSQPRRTGTSGWPCRCQYITRFGLIRRRTFVACSQLDARLDARHLRLVNEYQGGEALSLSSRWPQSSERGPKRGAVTLVYGAGSQPGPTSHMHSSHAEQTPEAPRRSGARIRRIAVRGLRLLGMVLV